MMSPEDFILLRCTEPTKVDFEQWVQEMHAMGDPQRWPGRLRRTTDRLIADGRLRIVAATAPGYWVVAA